ncbi:hypothetical protein GQ53DRAFT_823739 [Thozetella sp. PMI_491]|nr:hypothetical protein GQ53DRAFT_823739 [Thozetella sp. PMI_491]
MSTMTIDTTISQSATKTITSTVVNPATTCNPPVNVESSATVYTQSSNLTCGCPPGFLCDIPKPDDCNTWVGSPDKSYACASQYCVTVSDDFSTIKWPNNSTSEYPAMVGYFHLAQEAFGLSHDIFGYEVLVLDFRSTT